MKIDDCTTYSEKLALSHMLITDLVQQMYKDFDWAQEYPAELDTEKALQIESFLDDLDGIVKEGFDLFIELTEE